MGKGLEEVYDWMLSAADHAWPLDMSRGFIADAFSSPESTVSETSERSGEFS